MVEGCEKCKKKKTKREKERDKITTEQRNVRISWHSHVRCHAIINEMKKNTEVRMHTNTNIDAFVHSENAKENGPSERVLNWK